MVTAAVLAGLALIGAALASGDDKRLQPIPVKSKSDARRPVRR